MQLAAGVAELEHAPSEASEAYSDVFEEDMPDSLAKEDVSDAASVKSHVFDHSLDDSGAAAEEMYIPSYLAGKLSAMH